MRNNQIGVWCKEKENQDDNQGVEEKDEDEEVDLEIANFWKENNKEEKRWKETITKQEQRCDLLTDVIQQQHQVKASLVDSLFQKIASPFTKEVDSYHLLEKFKVPNALIYTGLRDPVEHLDSFRAHLDLHETPDEVACRAFPLTLSGSAQDWFRKLPPSSISNFEDLRRVFLSQFMVEG